MHANEVRVATQIVWRFHGDWLWASAHAGDPGHTFGHFGLSAEVSTILAGGRPVP
jgi:hypothetical protein